MSQSTLQTRSDESPDNPPFAPSRRTSSGPSAERLLSYARHSEGYAWVATAVVAIVPCMVLIGWALNIDRLKRVIPGRIEMNPMTAVLFFAAAASLSLQRVAVRPAARTAAKILAGLVAIVAAVKLQGFVTGHDGGIDCIFFHEKLTAPSIEKPNRMAINTAISFLMCGAALLTIETQTRRGWRPAQALAIAIGGMSLLALLGYAFGAENFYGIGHLVPMAVHTAFCFILMSSAILAAYPRYGVMRLVLNDSPGGAMLRRLFPAAILVPLLLALFRQLGLYWRWFEPEFGVAIFVVLTMAAFGLLAWINAKVLESADAKRLSAESDLNQERNLLRSLIDNIPDHIYIKDMAGRYIVDNVSHSRFVGASETGQVIGKTVADFFPPELAQKYTVDDNAVLESGEPLIAREEPIIDRKGNPMWIATTKVPVRDAAGRVAGLVCVSRDISRRKKAEQEMLELQNFLFSIIENIPNMLFVKDAEQLRFVRFNHAGELLLGYPREDLIGKNDYDMFPKDEADFFIAKDRAVLNERKMLDIPAEPIMTRHGERILHTKKIPILIEGIPRYLLGISEDITDRVQAEQQLREQNIKLMEMARSEREASDALKRAQSQMLQTEKLAALGQLVAGVAHEINNPLSFVNNNVAVLQRDVAAIRELLLLYQSADGELQQSQPELLAKIRELCDRMDLAYTLTNLDELLLRSRDGLRRIQQIVKDLRDFARLDESELQEIDLNHGIESTVNIVRGRAKGMQVVIDLDLHPLPAIVCYPAKVNQVVMNLVSNAMDACPGGGKVTVRTSALEKDGGVRIEVIDTGTGIPPAVRDRIFDPFFTTKPQGEGTGLGLSISYGIVRDHHGTIEVDSTPGKGTTFTVKLPKTLSKEK